MLLREDVNAMRFQPTQIELTTDESRQGSKNLDAAIKYAGGLSGIIMSRCVYSYTSLC